jgi:hypothetical protein
MDQPSTAGRKASAFFFFLQSLASIEHGGFLVSGVVLGDFFLQSVASTEHGGFLVSGVVPSALQYLGSTEHGGFLVSGVVLGDFLASRAGERSKSAIPAKS